MYNPTRHLSINPNQPFSHTFQWSVAGDIKADAEFIGCRFWRGSEPVIFATTQNEKITITDDGEFELHLSPEDTQIIDQRMLYDITAIVKNAGHCNITKGLASPA